MQIKLIKKKKKKKKSLAVPIYILYFWVSLTDDSFLLAKLTTVTEPDLNNLWWIPFIL